MKLLWQQDFMQNGWLNYSKMVLSHLIFLWLNRPELAFERVRERVSLGGHNIPEDVIFRRYFKGLQNFFNLYQPIADSWAFYDNSFDGEKIAEGNRKSDRIFKQLTWEKICKQAKSK